MTTVCMHGNLDLADRCRGDTLGTRWKLSESRVCQICCTHRACTLGKTGMSCLSVTARVQHCVSGCWAAGQLKSICRVTICTYSWLEGGSRTALWRQHKPICEIHHIPDPTALWPKRSWSCREQQVSLQETKGFPIKKNRDWLLAKGSVKFLPSFPQFHETAWEHGE